MNYARPLNLSPCTTGGLSIPLQDAEGKFTGYEPCMVADALTKSLPGPALSKHRDIMMGHMPFFARLLHCGSQPFYSRFLHSA